MATKVRRTRREQSKLKQDLAGVFMIVLCLLSLAGMYWAACRYDQQHTLGAYAWDAYRTRTEREADRLGIPRPAPWAIRQAYLWDREDSD